MSPEEFTTKGRELLGYGWQTKLAKKLNRNVQTIRKWGRGTNVVPMEIVYLFDAWEALGSTELRQR